ncbi:MAG: acetolactate decarboxylase [Spiroplasma sp. hy2]|uniref:acetolactate decarboxylase n=1 Tax=Spiroplasma sp. hy2 TaxID=2490850 RepID=UPI003B6CE24B
MFFSLILCLNNVNKQFQQKVYLEKGVLLVMIQKFSNVYQFSTITSLAAGNFDGMIKLGTLLKQGNFGLGTFDHLDGELIVLDGVGYQLKSDGTVNEVTASMTSPFAVMAFFEEHQKINISQLTSYEEIQQVIVDNLPSLNLFYGIKINGLFSEIKTRTVSWQKKPYPTLLKASEQQGILNAKNINGDIVGFWTPSFANTLGVNGFHCHFINTEKNTGGHIFDFVNCKCKCSTFYMNENLIFKLNSYFSN